MAMACAFGSYAVSCVTYLIFASDVITIAWAFGSVAEMYCGTELISVSDVMAMACEVVSIAAMPCSTEFSETSAGPRPPVMSASVAWGMP